MLAALPREVESRSAPARLLPTGQEHPVGPTGAVALRWRSDADLRNIALRVGQAWQQWCLDWAVPCPGFLQSGETAPALAFNAWESGFSSRKFWSAGTATTDGADAWMLNASSSPATWIARALFGPEPSGTGSVKGEGRSPIAASVAETASEQLAQMLAELFDRNGAVPISAPSGWAEADQPVPAERPWSGGVHVQLSAGEDSTPALWLRLSYPAADAMLEESGRIAPRSRQLPRVVKSAEALGEQRVGVRVHLAEIELDLGSLLSLRVDDVVRIPHRLDEPLAVHLDPSGSEGASDELPLCRAFLGAKDAQRAICLKPNARGLGSN